MEFKLLLVDDEREVTALLAEFLSGQGYRLLLAGSGDEAIALLNREPVDLVVLDLHMPGLPGEEVLQHIKRKSPQTKVVVVSGFPERRVAVSSLGCDALLAKPFSIGALTHVLEALLARKDDEELRDYVLGPKAKEALPGQPVAQLLFLESSSSLSDTLVRFFEDPSKSEGVYKVYSTDTLDRTLAMMLVIHPDIVLVDLIALGRPAQVARALLSSEFQPKDYIFYLQSHLPEGEEFPSFISGKHWEGNPFQEEGLKELAQLVCQVAQEHSLVKR